MKYFSGRLAKASGLLFISTIVGGVLGYVFQVTMGRMLSIQDYGVFVALMALIALLGVPLSTLSMMLSRCASNYRANNQPKQIAAMFWWINGRIFWTALILAVCSLPFTPYIRDYARLESHLSVWILLILIFITLFIPVNTGLLQASQNFRWLAINGITTQGFKLVFCATTLYLGFELNGALFGMILATISTWVLTYSPLRSSLKYPSRELPKKDHPTFHGTIPVLFANFSFTLMTQLDLLLVNHYFDTHQAGIYAAAAILGKAVLYLPTSIAIALFPMVAENESQFKSSKKLLFNALGLTVTLSSTGAIFYYLLSDEIITILYGRKYQEASDLLKIYGFSMVPMSIVMVVEHFYIAKGRVIFAYFMSISVPFMFIASMNHHDHLINIVYILVAGSWSLAFVGFCFMIAQAFLSKSTDKTI